MTASEVAALLAEIGRLAELVDPNPFRARAYTQAARSLEGSHLDLVALEAADQLTSIPGVGPGIAQTIREVVTTGSSDVYRELNTRIPAGLHAVLRVPGLGIKKVRTLREQLGIESLDDLERAAAGGRVAGLSGFGAKTEQKILQGIAFLRTTLGYRRYPAALQIAVRLLEWLREHPAVDTAEIAGGLRRRLEVVDAVELVASSAQGDEVLRAFAALGGPAATWEEQRALFPLEDGFAVRLRCVPPERFVAAMVWETGSEAHLRDLAARADSCGLEFSADGCFGGTEPIALPAESALYEMLGLAYIPPELREGTGEVAAATGALPRLVELADLRGTFHCHTSYSDGTATVAEMAEAARARGWSYLGLADHSRSAGYAGGLSVAAVAKQHREVDAWNRANPGFRIFKGIESDILADGSLDYDDATLARFDYVVGSVHSGFGMSGGAMTERVLRAIRSPHLTILAHPTGRILLTRDAYALDLRAVIDACAEHGVAIEINADPHRLDLDWRHVRYAAERGVLIPINPDAHSPGGLDNVAFGVNMARKGWLEARQVLNTWTLDQVESYFAKRKQSS
ncbi:MAG: DNA polymerase/3'-5' exonuclease PolX [Gemmatimonadota bacterium]|nr:DNA polymerase/3'-5' exonuclease PolX [Gemmatimonadota bacterium]